MQSTTSVDRMTGSLVDQIRCRAVRTPDAPAVADFAESLTYARLWQRVEALARLLRARGARPGRPVGLCLSPTATRVAAILGVLGAGAPYLPLDPNTPDSRIRAMLDAAGARQVLVDGDTAARFGTLPYQIVDSCEYPGFESSGAAGATSAAVGALEPDAGDLAYIIYTSGSTGNPKGVAVEHAGISLLFEAVDRMLPPAGDGAAQCWLAAANPCFDMSVVDMFWPLTRGIPVVVAATEALAGRSAAAAGEGSGPAAEFLVGTLTGGRVTHFFATPSLAQLMLQDPALAAAVRGLKVLIIGGEVMHPELVARLRPVPYLYNAYGPTEATVITTMHECRDADAEAAYVPIGRPLHGVDVRVVDEEGRDCPPGALGELLIGGPTLARGYVNDEELTARKFPMLGTGADRRRWYRTGDLVSMAADRTIRYHARTDGQVKVRGYRVELGEVEAALRAVPGVAEAVVVPVRGTGGAVTGLRAAVMADATQQAEPRVARSAVSESAVLAAIERVLPWYAVPQTLKLMPDLPIGLTGKVDRQEVERRLARLAPVAAADVTAADGAGIAARPGTGSPGAGAPPGVARFVAAIWQEVLGLDTPAAGDQTFFDLGGDSALLGAAFARLHAAFPEAGLQLVDMYRYPTVPVLAARLAAGQAGREAPAGPGGPGAPRPATATSSRSDGTAPLSAAQRRRLARRGQEPARGHGREGSGR